MSLERYFSELMEEGKSLKKSALVRFSGLLPEEMDGVRRFWPRLEAERRWQIMTWLVEMATDNVELDFGLLFRHCLNDPDSRVRELAVAGLWESDDRTLIVPLVGLLQRDSAAEVRSAAAIALGKFADLAEDGKLIPRDRKRIQDALICTIQQEDETLEVRRRAMEAVAPGNSPKVHELIEWAYTSSDSKLRQSALCAMGRNGESRWLPLILKETASEDSAMRYEAATACGALGDEAVLPTLARLVKDEDQQVQMAAILALGKIGGSVARRVLKICLRSDDEAVREAAQETLDEMDSV